MRQARAAMRSGAASSRDAARQALATANPKWQPGLSPLEEEEKLKVIVPTSAQQVRQINRMIDTLLDANDLDPDVRKALALWKTNYQMESVPDQVRRAFLEGFWCWLLGRGTDEDTRRTLWGRGNVAAHNREVAAYLELFARKRTEYAARLVLMAEHVPDTLNGFYLYYKVTFKAARLPAQLVLSQWHLPPLLLPKQTLLTFLFFTVHCQRRAQKGARSQRSQQVVLQLGRRAIFGGLGLV